MKWDELRARLQQDKGQWVRIGRESGVNPSQLSRYANGNTTPTVVNFERLAAYYAAQEVSASGG
jgi:transcriptional regulator with XRE-family HTH domain